MAHQPVHYVKVVVLQVKLIVFDHPLQAQLEQNVQLVEIFSFELF